MLVEKDFKETVKFVFRPVSHWHFTYTIATLLLWKSATFDDKKLWIINEAFIYIFVLLIITRSDIPEFLGEAWLHSSHHDKFLSVFL